MENTRGGSIYQPIGYPSAPSINMVTNAGSFSYSRYGDEAMLHKNNHEVKSRTVQRSVSFGSNHLKPGKFKLKTPGVFLDVESPDDCQGVEGGTK